jgi:ATPase subunit of ABC transporter with duplicated ATPase domains
MKCIKSIKETKDVAVGTIRRVDDKTANNMVGNYWAYVAKSEWKKETRKSKPKEEVVQEKNQPEEKKPYKKGERSEKHKNKQ